MRPADGRGEREEKAGNISAGDAFSAVAELATQSMPKKSRYEDTRPRRRKTRIYPKERQLRTPTEFFGLSRSRSRNWNVAERQLIDEKKIKEQNATSFPRFTRDKSTFASKVGGWEVVALALLHIRIWMSL